MDVSFVIVNETPLSAPVAGALPVPVQPVQTRRVPFSGSGAIALATTSSP